jgi:Mce-associated membrane protein
VSTPDPDSETAVAPTPAQTPTDDTAEAPTEQVEAAEPTDKPVEAAESTDQPVEAGEATDKPVDVTDEPAEPVDAVEKPAEEPADKPADERPADERPADERPADEQPADAQPADDASDEPAGALATDAPAADGLRSRRMLVPIVLAVLALGSAVAVAVLGWQTFSDARTQRAQDAALEAARTSTIQVLSYDSKTLDADLARSRALISGTFAAKFEELASGVIVPAVKQQNLGTKATVARSAVIDAQPDQVRALLFVNQATTIGSDPAPHTAANQVRVTMTWTDGRWLISDLQPL